MKIKKLKKLNLDFFNFLILFFIILLPSQFGKHFFLDFSYIYGVRVDYLAYVLYLTDIIALILIYLQKHILISFYKNRTVGFVFFLLFVSVFFSFSTPVALFRFWKIFEVVSLFVIFTKTKLKQVFVYWGILVLSLIQLFLVILQFINQHSIQGFFYFLGERYFNSSMPGIAKVIIKGNEIIRPYGTFSHPNSMAGFFLLIYSFVLGSNLNKNPVIKNLIIFVLSILIFISFSKTAILGYILVNIIFLIRKVKKSECKICVISRTIIFSVAAILFIFGKTDPLSLIKRLVLFENSYDILSMYPVTGVGLGNYLIAQATLDNEIFSFPVQPVHNIFMLFLTETGIFLGIGIMYILYRKFKRYLRFDLFLLCFIAFFITGSFDHYWLTLQQNFLQIGVFFGLITNRRVVF
jgi:hypothetical protein